MKNHINIYVYYHRKRVPSPEVDGGDTVKVI